MRTLSCRQLIQQRLRLFKIERVEALGEPSVDRCQKLASLVPLALIAPEASDFRREIVGREPSFASLLITQVVLCCLIGAFAGPMSTALAEQFPAHVRSTSSGAERFDKPLAGLSSVRRIRKVVLGSTWLAGSHTREKMSYPQGSELS
jgi:hypothetical protein